MNFDNRIRESFDTSLLVCRDRGRMTWRGGGLVPVPRRYLIRAGFEMQTDRLRTRTGTRTHDITDFDWKYSSGTREMLNKEPERKKWKKRHTENLFKRPLCKEGN